MVAQQRSLSELLAVLRSHENELRARGVEALTLFGSLARGEATSSSDVDLAIRAGADFSSGGFNHFGRLEALREHLAELLECEVDLVEEPAVRPQLRRIIAEEGVRAF
jgi:predicted nucleotidyltransferase